MRRGTRLRAAASVAVLALALGGSGAAAQEEERIVRIDTLNVRDTLYHLSDGGANAMALIDEINGGVVLIDAKSPGWGPAVREAVYGVTDLPVTTIVLTHPHPDSAGSLSEYPDLVEVVAHERAAASLADSVPDGVTLTTFGDRHALLEDLDRIELYHFGPAHTGGDTIVVFPQKGVAFLGDLFPGKAAPEIDRDNGGSGVAFPETLARAVAGIEGVERVITGRDAFPSTYAGRGRREEGRRRPWTGWMTWDDVAEYADFNRDFLAAVEAAYDAGRSVDEAAAALALPERYRDYGMEHARANIEAIYAELEAR
ncbi:MAG: MBL fold metallo-hydrolase [Acidobacteria bacterium]|nr:MBL fold metallo-hydrolase [Acidobacteriota bacterium]